MSKVRIPIRGVGDLGGKGFSKLSKVQRRKLINRAVKKFGEKSVVSKLIAVGVLNKNRNPKLSKQFFNDASRTAGRFIGRRKVKFPRGFSGR